MSVLHITIPLITFMFDRLTKWWAVSFLCQKPLAIWGSTVSCLITYNKGVSWSLLAFDGAAGFWIIGTLIMFVIILLLWHMYSQYTQDHAIYGELLVLGGALSNFYDRFLYGGVVDFILLQYGDWAFPVFNCADIAIVCGVLLMVYEAATTR
jgi:signal peptidase II